MSFLVLCGRGEVSGIVGDEEEEREECGEGVEAGLGLLFLQGELGADADVRGQFSSVPSM